MEGDYRSFLKSLDNDEFLSHISSISQSQDQEKTHNEDNRNLELDQGDVTQVDDPIDIRDISTPLKRASVRSDPFDDSFNEALLAGEAGKGNALQLNNALEAEGPQTTPEWDDEAHHSNDEGDVFDSNDEEDQSDNDDSIGPAHDFGDYRTYFDNKHLKQQKQDDEYRQWDLKRRQEQGEDTVNKDIFHNCIIHVNGHTVPSINEIHKLVILYGGKFLAFLGNKSAATHIICDRLTPRKQIQLKNCRVVKAKWIVDCIEANTLLDWKPYRLFKEIAYDQQRLGFKNHEPQNFATGQYNMEALHEEVDGPGLLEQEIENQNQLDDEQDTALTQESQIAFANNRDDTNKAGKLAIMDAKHPNFLEHFFANSRLHHLSIWKSDLRLAFLKKVIKTGKTTQTSGNNNKRLILHVDFDCFFATASCQKHKNLDLQKDPIAVSHGNNTSDIASCNYVARKAGVKNGMWVRSAKRLCPNLILIDYEFDLYEKYAEALYNYLINMASCFDTIFPVLIDEVLIDATSYIELCEPLEIDSKVTDLCNKIRNDIFNLTKCSISIGASHNVLLAKLALKKSKPDGFYYLSKDVETFLSSVSVRDLPGVGYSLVEKLCKELGSDKEPQLQDLQKFPKERLKNIFGPKTGDKLYEYSRGIDHTSIELDTTSAPALLGRKSVSVDVNFGIRFDDIFQVETFMASMAGEVSKRLKLLGVIGSQIALKLAIRAKDAPVNPPKYLGMGRCDFSNKTARLGVPTNDWGIIAAELKSLTRILNIDPKELRGVAVTISKLDDYEQYNKTKQQKLPFGGLSNTKVKKDYKPMDTSKFKDPLDGTEIDQEVFDSLPWNIRKEIKDEMVRRGMLSKETTPKRADDKVYLQQLLPMNDQSQLQYVRVIESPKRPKKKSRTSLPQKAASVTPKAYEEDLSYDSSVLNELPSSVRDEVVEDLETRKRQRLNPQSLKGKFIRIAEKTERINQPITDEWVSQQPTLAKTPLFLNSQYSYSDMVNMINGWILESLRQDGPHQDDVGEFTKYLRQLLSQNNLSRCCNLIQCIKTELNAQQSIDNVTGDQSRIIAFKEWNDIINTKFVTIVQAYCSQMKIKCDAL